jgi:hypothetical protein
VVQVYIPRQATDEHDDETVMALRAFTASLHKEIGGE